MELTLSFMQTLMFLVFCIFIDSKITKKFKFVRNCFLPSLFIGGCFISFLNFLFQGFIAIRLDNSVSMVLITLFFTSIGLRYTKKTFLKSLSKQMLFLLIAIMIAIFQNVIAVTIGNIFSETTENIMMQGSMVLMGDGSLSTRLMPTEYIKKLSGIETFTIIIGTIACGFTLYILSKRKGKLDTSFYVTENKSRKNLITHIVIFTVIVLASFRVARFSVFSFLLANGIAYILALFTRWYLDKYNVYKIDNGYVNKLGNYFLSMFIMLKFSSLKIGDLKYLEVINIVIILLQVSLLIIVSYYIVYKLYKEDTLAVYVSAALVGYSIGIPPSTMAVLQHAGKEKGTIHEIVMIVPVVGAWLITLINPYIIKIFFMIS